jgi:hypothetical protein
MAKITKMKPFTQPQIKNLQWILVNEDQPEDFENVLATIKGYDEVVIAARWGKGWFLINDFIQKYKGDDGTVKVIAWMPLPEIYRKKKLKNEQNIFF